MDLLTCFSKTQKIMRTNYFSLKAKILPLVVASSVSFGQNFTPFNANVTKRFYNSVNPADKDYFFYSDSTSNHSSGLTVFHQYFTLQQAPLGYSISNCGFWGPAAKDILDTTWLGAVVLYNSNTSHLILKNAAGDTLDFDFSIQPGDSAKFYENAAGAYFIKAGPQQNETVYTVTDAVKTFTILHYDVNGQLMSTGLNGKPVKIGQQTGLIAFFDAYHFPGVETHLTLRGQLNPLLGTYQIRLEHVFPFQVGDSMQYQGYKGLNCDYFRNYRVVGRQETTDSVTIMFKSSVHYPPSILPPSVCPPIAVYPDTLIFKKNSDLIGFPYNKVDEDTYPLTSIGVYGQGYEFRTEFIMNNFPCVSNRLSYTGEALPFRYCEACLCIGDVDAYAYPNGLVKRTYADGMGIVVSGLRGYDNWGEWTGSATLVHSSIGGEVCGNYVAVGLPQLSAISGMDIYPNPVKNELKIRSKVDVLNVYSLHGTLVRTFKNPGSSVRIDELPGGLYLVQVVTGTRSEYRKIVKQ